MNEKDSPVKERLLIFINYKDLTNARFLKMCGLSGSFVQNMRKSIPIETFDLKIAPVFPELNKYWLLEGKGEMIVSEEADKASSDEIEKLKSDIKKQEKYIESLEKNIEHLEYRLLQYEPKSKQGIS